MRVKDWIKEGFATSSQYGKVAIVGAKSGSKTQVDIRVVQRGQGWCEMTEEYRRYFSGATWSPAGRSLHWGLTRVDEYGMTDTVHIKTLKKC